MLLSCIISQIFFSIQLSVPKSFKPHAYNLRQEVSDEN